MTFSLAAKLSVLLLFIGSTLYVHLRGKARLPMLRLDRIYVRGFSVQQAQVHVGGSWSKISDHAALSAQLALPG